jgi:lipopolysaccharide export system protein LptA
MKRTRAITLSRRLILASACLGLAAVAQQIDPEVPFTPEPFTPTVTLERNDKVIIAKKFGPDEEGLLVICTPNDEDAKRLTKTYFVDKAPYFVHVYIDENVIRAPVVVAAKEDGGDGELEAYAGTATFVGDDDNCKVDVKPEPKPGTVFVTQGKTKLTGSQLKYTQETGIAVIDGPIVFERPQSSGSVLKGSSQKITVDVDNEKTFLEGNVKLDSKCRTSVADRVEYDDKANLAILFGKPAVSKRIDGTDEITAERLEYNLDTNDVVLESDQDVVKGEFNDEAQPCSEN